MKIVFMGTPDFSVAALEELIKAGHEILGVVTQPDKPKGRGKEVLFTPVKEAAIKHNIPVYQPAKVRDEEFVKILSQINPDVFIVVAFGQILPASILNMGKYGCINIHASLLPKYRGSAPIQYVILAGEEKTGITTMKMDEGIDTGDILMTCEVKIDPKETGGSLHDKLAVCGGKLIVETLKEIETNGIEPVKQDNEKSNYVGMIRKSLGNIDFTKSAVEIERLIRGLNPWPSAYTKLNGKTLKIWEADVINENYQGEPGEIVKATKDTLYIKTGKGIISVNQLQLEGKKRMDIDTFLLGNSIKEGTILNDQ